MADGTQTDILVNSMAVVNCIKLIDQIKNWLTANVNKSGRKILTLPYQNSSSFYLSGFICSLTKIPTLVVLNQPNESILLFSQKYGLGLSKPDSFNTFQDVLSLNSSKNGIIISSIDRNNFNLIRNYNKYTNGGGDLLPVADLFNSEIEEVLLETDNSNYIVKSNTQIFDLSLEEIEWADRQNIIFNIVEDEKDPLKNPNSLGYMGRQKQIISKIYQREKLTRHKKSLHGLVCSIRNVDGLVR